MSQSFRTFVQLLRILPITRRSFSQLKAKFSFHPCNLQQHLTGMETRSLEIDPSAIQFTTLSSLLNPQTVFSSEAVATAIQDAATVLKSGEVVAMPTETVYGLAANALNPLAIRKIYTAKNRPPDNPLIVHISSLSMLESIIPDNHIPSVYLPIIERFWPGPLTVIVQSNATLIPPEITAGQSTVAVRFPSHPVARALITACGFPLAAPSANSSGKPSPTLASHVADDLDGKIPLILDGGACDVGIESTVLDAIRSPPAILRPGGITYEQLVTMKGMSDLMVYRRDFIDKALEDAPTTPGMKYRHYSPEATVILFERGGTVLDGENEDGEKKNVEARQKSLSEAIDTQIHLILSNLPFTKDIITTKIGILTTSPLPLVSTHKNLELHHIFLGADLVSVAHNLFAALRELDGRGVEVILVEGVEEVGEGLAVMNRIRKAASQTIMI